MIRMSEYKYKDQLVLQF